MKTGGLTCSFEITEATRNALRAAIGDLWTTSQIGVSWVARHEGNADYYQLDGLAPLAVATKGPILLLANSGETLKSLLGRAPLGPTANSQGAEAGQIAVATKGPILLLANSGETLKSLLGRAPLGPTANSQEAEVSQNVVYAAGFRHSAERHNIVEMMRLIEMPLPQQYGGLAGEEGRTPSFFSENLASLSQSLESIESESLVVEDHGPQLHQTVTYRLKK